MKKIFTFSITGAGEGVLSAPLAFSKKTQYTRVAGIDTVTTRNAFLVVQYKYTAFSDYRIDPAILFTRHARGTLPAKPYDRSAWKFCDPSEYKADRAECSAEWPVHKERAEKKQCEKDPSRHIVRRKVECDSERVIQAPDSEFPDGYPYYQGNQEYVTHDSHDSLRFW